MSTRTNTRANTNNNPFYPLYETPKNRQRIVETTTLPPTTESPLDRRQSYNAVRHRRPQFDAASRETTTINPFAAYADPSRKNNQPEQPAIPSAPPLPTADNSLSGNQLSPSSHPQSSSSFSFTYNTPGNRNRETSSVTITNHLPPSSSQGGSQSPATHSVANPLLHPHEANDQPGLNRHQVSHHQSNSVPNPNPSSIFSDPFFSYNSPPDRFHSSSTKQEATVTEPSASSFSLRPENNHNAFNPIRTANHPNPFTSTHEISRHNNHENNQVVRIRLPPPNRDTGFRGILPDPVSSSSSPHHGSSTGRRATRVRVSNFNHANTFQPIPASVDMIRTSNHPGVLYDDNASTGLGTDSPPGASFSDPQPFLALTTRKPRRKRPPQRAHLRNRPEENPVSALINLPPPNLQVEPLHPAHQPQHQPLTNPRPLPPRPQNPPPRILPIDIPLGIPTPPPARIPGGQSSAFRHFNHHQNQPPFYPVSIETTQSPIRLSSEPGYGPNTVRFSNLLPQNQQQPTPRPAAVIPDDRDIFVTDFPFYDLHTNPPQYFTTTTTTPAPIPTTTEAVTQPPRIHHNHPHPSTNTRGNRGRQQQSSVQQPAIRRPVPQPQPVATTTRAPRILTEEPVVPSGPPVAMDNTGGVSCVRRGVFAHPQSCGQFVVCAPVSRGSSSYRPYTHHCPAEQVFVEEVGRCRPGNKERCEVFT